ncbi:MAG TPA: serine hydrolase [Bacteroidales bacterium]|nr:serine hydrolase [Bacteroidales bacterium]
MKKLLLSFVILLIAGKIVAQESQLPAFVVDSLESYISRGMTKWRIPAVSCAIVKDGKVIFVKGFGVTDLQSKQKVNEHTLFMIGSNTKAFTTTTLAILQEEGKLSLNDRVQKWMPEFRLKDTLASNNVTIADLLSNHIGFETFQGDFTYWTSNLSRAEVIHRMALIDAPYSFRSKYGYCNAAFLTAGELIPRIIGKTWEETVKEKILQPLQMERTLLLAREFKGSTNKTLPYTMVDDNLWEMPIPDLDNLASAASMSSSASDMAIWLQAQLNTGKLSNSQKIPEKAFLTIRKPQTIISADGREKQRSHFQLYGLGLRMMDRNNRIVYSHSGAVDGFLSMVMFVPEDKLGIVVMTNTDKNSFYQSLSYEILDAFLGLPYKGYSDITYASNVMDEAKTKSRLDSLRNVIKLNKRLPLPMKDYAGVYKDAVYGTIEVKQEKGSLNIYFSHHPALIGKLEYINNNVFLCTYSNPLMGVEEIPFKMEANRIVGLTLRVDDFLEFTSYEFVKVQN